MTEREFSKPVYTANLQGLSDLINQHFSLSDLKHLGFELGLDMENIPGETKQIKVIELVKVCVRAGLLKQLLETCQRLRPEVAWLSVLETITTERRSRWQWEVIIAFVSMIIGGVIGWGAFVSTFEPVKYIVPGLVADAQIYSFEDGIVGSEWRLDHEAENPHILDTYAYDGDHALAIDADVRAREEEGDPLAVATLRLAGQDLENKAVIFRVYVPEDAPTNLAGQFSLESRGIYGRYTFLRPGEWTTVTWATYDAPPWEGPANLDFHLILGAPDEDSDTDNPTFDGTFYVDGVEILPLPKNYINTLTLAASTFDNEVDDWQTGGAATEPTPVASGGNPGGFISAEDDAGEDWYWIAPEKFLTSMSNAYGGVLIYDLKQSPAEEVVSIDDHSVTLIGNNGMRLVFDTYDPGTDWTTYAIVLNESAGWKVQETDQAPTAEQMKAVLSSLSELRIRGEFQRHSQDIGGLDNVMLLRRP